MHTIERATRPAARSGAASLAASRAASRAGPPATSAPPPRKDQQVALRPGTAVEAASEIAPYHPAWSARFRVEAEVLRVALATLTPVIEHVGSTAVPGLAAVPVIDMALGVADPTAVDAHAERLSNFGYRLMSAPEYMATDRRVLMRTVRGVRTHHVHVVTAFGDAWHRLLMFRDMLRLDPDLATTYAALKRELARQTQGRPLMYAVGKADFIRSILGRPAFTTGGH
ncbi:MAG: GrpB family protein [Burkholderiaceae bacterium]|nr:GrpB family protein [Burkholderiaceae bacterium]